MIRKIKGFRIIDGKKYSLVGMSRYKRSAKAIAKNAKINHFLPIFHTSIFFPQ